MRWQEPPEKRRGRGRSARIDRDVAELRANPGRWALVREAASAGMGEPYRKRGCEVFYCERSESTRARRRFDLYAQWPAAEEDEDLTELDPDRIEARIPAVTPSGRTVLM